jgi:hypothetical protein
MDTEGDLECTCDVGPFATCPACRARTLEVRKERTSKGPQRVKQNDEAALAQRIAEIKAGYMK